MTPASLADDKTTKLPSDWLQPLWNGRDVVALDDCGGAELHAIAQAAASVTGVVFGSSNSRPSGLQRVLRGTPTRLPLKSSSADVVVVFNKLAWLLDSPDAVAEIFRVLRTDGVFCVVRETLDEQEIAAVAASVGSNAVENSVVIAGDENGPAKVTRVKDLPLAQGGNAVAGARGARTSGKSQRVVFLAGNSRLAPLIKTLTSPRQEERQAVVAMVAPVSPDTHKGSNGKSRPSPARPASDRAASSPPDASPELKSDLLEENEHLRERMLIERGRMEASQRDLAAAVARLSVELEQRSAALQAAIREAAVSRDSEEAQSLRERLADTETRAAERIRELEAAHDNTRRELQSRVAELEEELNRPRAPEPGPGGRAAMRIAGESNAFRTEVVAARWQKWADRRKVRARGARLLRGKYLRPALRRFGVGRAAILLTSAMAIPQDGPGRRAIFNHAARKPDAPDPHPLFSSAYYAQWAPDVAAAGALGAIHYLSVGDSEGRSPHPLFDAKWYRENNGGRLANWRMTTLEHYLAVGVREGLRPHPLFDPYHYVVQCEDLEATGREPLSHYLASGWREGRNPHPLFDTSYYLERNPDVLNQGVPPLLHYVLTGWQEGRDPHPLFSTSYYLSSNADVAALGINPLVHYVNQGWREGRRPHPRFDPQWYFDNNPDVAQANIEPLTHYLTRGGWEHRPATPEFDSALFAALHPEEISSGRTPLETWARMGFKSLSSETAGGSGSSRTGGGFSGGASKLFEQMSHRAGDGRNDQYSWPSYMAISSAIRTSERQRIEGLQPKPVAMISIAESDLAKAASRLAFKRHAQPAVTVLVPVFNQLKTTIECLTSLAATRSKATMEVIVADDASTDDTQSILSGVSGLVYVRSNENLGFLRNVNAAAARATGEILIILNNDTQLAPDWLDPLLAALEDDTIGIVAPKFVFPNGRLQEAGARLTADGSSQMIGLFDDASLPRFNYARDVDYASGACIAMRRSLFNELGGFDDAYAPAYCEDVDICMRVKKRGLRVRYEPASTVYHHLSKSSDAMPDSFKLRQVRRNQQKLMDRWGDMVAAMDKTRIISFYLPQFHRVPENDRWWGPGFTEWRNVQRALPNFSGHYQPHRPGELGYYDLTNPEVMEAQAELARSYGVHGFCYYYYSFSGRRILEKPIEAMLASGKPDLPFCICWANENWTRKWDGGDQSVLLAQNYTPEDDQTIIEDMIRYLRSPNYIKVNGRPLLAVYRPQLLPNARRTTDLWRRVCREKGIGEIHLAMVEVFENARTQPNPNKWGFDATIEFPPAGMSIPTQPPGERMNPDYKGIVSDYRQIVQDYLKEPIPGHTRYRGVMPSWDNTARRQNDSFAFINATPGAFQAWLEAIIDHTKDQNCGDERIVFVNAWNEWAEGAHLEPDEKFGRGWLEAVRNAQESERLLISRRQKKPW